MSTIKRTLHLATGIVLLSTMSYAANNSSEEAQNISDPLADIQNDRNVTEKAYSEQNWGIGVAMRSASIPYTAQDSSVNTFAPMLFLKMNISFYMV